MKMESKQNRPYVKPASAIFRAEPELLTVSGGGNIVIGGGVNQGGPHAKENDMWDDTDDGSQD